MTHTIHRLVPDYTITKATRNERKELLINSTNKWMTAQRRSRNLAWVFGLIGWLNFVVLLILVLAGATG